MKSIMCSIIFCFFISNLPAQTVLQKVVISSGGQWTTNTLYQANLSIGQSLAMKSESESGEACIGFWYDIKDRPLSRNKLEKFSLPTRISIKPINTILELKVYPNPVFDHTQIEFELAENGLVRLSMIDIQGREVDVIMKEYLQEGKYRIKYNAMNKFSGMYTVQLSVNGERMHKNLIITR